MGRGAMLAQAALHDGVGGAGGDAAHVGEEQRSAVAHVRARLAAEPLGRCWQARRKRQELCRGLQHVLSAGMLLALYSFPAKLMSVPEDWASEAEDLVICVARSEFHGLVDYLDISHAVNTAFDPIACADPSESSHHIS